MSPKLVLFHVFFFKKIYIDNLRIEKYPKKFPLKNEVTCFHLNGFNMRPL